MKLPIWGDDSRERLLLPTVIPLESGLKPKQKVVQKVDTVKIEVRGISGSPSRVYDVPYKKDQPLRYYLRSLHLLTAGIDNALYDLSNTVKGRIRIDYIVRRESVILITNSSYGLRSHLQRQRGASSVKQIDEAPLTYSQSPSSEKRVTKLKNEEGIFENLDQV